MSGDFFKQGWFKQQYLVKPPFPQPVKPSPMGETIMKTNQEATGKIVKIAAQPDDKIQKVVITNEDCVKFKKMMEMCTPPATGTSKYAVQGSVYPIESDGYPMWVMIVTITAVVAAILLAKKS